MSRELADCDADVSERSLDLIAIGFALVGAVEIEESIVPGRDLDGLVTIGFRPFRNSSLSITSLRNLKTKSLSDGLPNGWDIQRWP